MHRILLMQILKTAVDSKDNVIFTLSRGLSIYDITGWKMGLSHKVMGERVNAIRLLKALFKFKRE